MEKLTFKVALIVVAASLAATSAHAQNGFRLSSKSIVPKAPVATPTPRLNNYFFGYGGVAFQSSWSNTGAFDLHPGWIDHCPPGLKGVPPFDPLNIPMDWDPEAGWTLGGGVGRYSGLFGGSRFELEGTYLNNDVSHLHYAGFLLPANFELATTAVMVNYLKEIPLGGVTGYFGGGIGWGWTTMRGDIDTIRYSDSDDGFAWQLIAGVDFPITERLALFTQYRYLVLSEQSFTTDFGDFTNSTNSDPSSHSVLVGARVSF
jgi:opacity protein-like surface antigen